MPLLPDPRLPTPPLVTAICIPQATQSETFKHIRRLERPPLPKYSLARQSFDTVLGGQSWEWAYKEADAHPDRQQSRHAVDLLKACKSYLVTNRGARISGFGSMFVDLNAGLRLPVGIDSRTASSEGERAVAYHLWRTPLTESQERLAFSLFRRTLWAQPGCAGIPFDLITAPLRKILGRRSLRILTAEKVHPSDDAEVEHFKTVFVRDWDAYHEAHPRRGWAHNRK